MNTVTRLCTENQRINLADLMDFAYRCWVCRSEMD